MNKKIKDECMKIKTLDELMRLFSDREQGGEKIVLCHGVFDVLHVGHIKHFRVAKAHGDVLIVSVTSDKYVDKGEGRPIFDQNLRAETISALELVDCVYINDFPTASELIRKVKPNFYVKGIEYKNSNSRNFLEEEEVALFGGCKIVYTADETYSSTNIVNKNRLPSGTFDFIQKFKKKYAVAKVQNYFDEIKNLKVLVIGEVIIDSFCFGEHLGKMRRESLMEFGINGTINQVGGSGAIANHIANFAKEVTLFTMVGDYNSKKDFIERELNKNIERIFFVKKKSPTPSKTRYIEKHVNHRNVFKTSEMNDNQIGYETSSMMMSKLIKILPEFDMVVVSDFGHGMIDKRLINYLSAFNIFLAVSTQLNTENQGFNTIDKYPRVDYGCINESELRILMKDKYASVPLLINRLRKQNYIDTLSVTRGFRGGIVESRREGLFENPPFSVDALDTIGAGDAFFAITSLLAKKNMPIDMLLFVGNAMGALQIKQLGNDNSIKRKDLEQYLGNLLK